MNPIPNLKNQIRILNSIYMCIFIFLIILMYFFKIPQWFLITISILFLMNYYSITKKVKNNEFFLQNVFLKNQYEKLILKWLISYIQSSKDLVEKEYKLMFLGLFINHHSLKNF